MFVFVRTIMFWHDPRLKLGRPTGVPHNVSEALRDGEWLAGDEFGIRLQRNSVVRSWRFRDGSRLEKDFPFDQGLVATWRTKPRVAISCPCGKQQLGLTVQREVLAVAVYRATKVKLWAPRVVDARACGRPRPRHACAGAAACQVHSGGLLGFWRPNQCLWLA